VNTKLVDHCLGGLIHAHKIDISALPSELDDNLIESGDRSNVPKMRLCEVYRNVLDGFLKVKSRNEGFTRSKNTCPTTS